MTSPEEKFWNNQAVIETFASLKTPPYWEKFFSSLPRPAQWRVLDIGCGGGRISTMIAAKGFNLWACDKYRGMIMETKHRLSRFLDAKNLKKRVIQAEMTKLPFLNYQFDCVVANGIYHNANSVEQMRLAIKETNRVLRPGGFACINTFYNGFIDNDIKKDTFTPYRFFTKEGLSMILIPKKLIIEFLRFEGFSAIGNITCYKSSVLTGKRSVLRGIFIKSSKPF